MSDGAPTEEALQRERIAARLRAGQQELSARRLAELHAVYNSGCGCEQAGGCCHG